jgi:hypothetical protein
VSICSDVQRPLRRRSREHRDDGVGDAPVALAEHGSQRPVGLGELVRPVQTTHRHSGGTLALREKRVGGYDRRVRAVAFIMMLLVASSVASWIVARALGAGGGAWLAGAAAAGAVASAGLRWRKRFAKGAHPDLSRD